MKTTEMVLQMDPFRRQISVAERDRIVIDAFATAGQRLKSCAIPKRAGTASQPNLSDHWATLQPQINAVDLRRDPDLVETAMDLVFGIERQTSALCGAPSGSDEALLLIARLHEGT